MARRRGCRWSSPCPATPRALNQQEVPLYGARLHLVDGLISDAGAWVAEGVAREGWYDASTFKEPYRLEGKKTLGLEIAEQLGWTAPDVILYPTGGGVGLLGLWKAFRELRALGWLAADTPLPRLVVVQAAGCAPVVRAWEAGASTTEFWQGAATVAAGLRVPGPLAGGLMLRVLHETGGTALAVDDAELRRALGELARRGCGSAPKARPSSRPCAAFAPPAGSAPASASSCSTPAPACSTPKCRRCSEVEGTR